MLKSAIINHAGRTPVNRVARRDDTLLDTAMQLFLERGFAQVSIDLIARTAGVAARTIYVHFGDKHGLLSKLIERERAMERESARMLEAASPGVEHLLCGVALNMLMRTLSAASRNLHADVLASRYDGSAERDDPVNCSAWREVLKRCFLSPEWSARAPRSFDTELLCDMFIGCVLGAQLRALKDRSVAALDERASHVLANQLAQQFIAASTGPAGE